MNRQYSEYRSNETSLYGSKADNSAKWKFNILTAFTQYCLYFRYICT